MSDPGQTWTGRFARLALATVLAASSSTSLPGPAHAAPGAGDSLGTSSEVPWNPPEPMPRRRGWEQAVLLPGRVLSLPLVGLGLAADNLLFRMEQSPRYANVLTPPAGLAGGAVRVRTARLGDRTGLGGAVEVHADVLRGVLASRVAAEYAATLHQYNRTLLTWTGRPLSLQFGEEWRPQERFYGLGNDAALGDASDYATHVEFLRGGLGWESRREGNPARTRLALALWAGPHSQVTRTGREAGVASWEKRFPAPGAATLDRRVEHMVYGASFLDDRRTGAPRWNRGWRTLLSAERFAAPIQALALRSGDGEGARFTRYRAEAEGGFSFLRDPRTVRLLVRVSDLDAGAHADHLLLSDLATLGGQAGLAGFTPGRFHDNDLLLTRLDYVFPLQRFLELDLRSEWGAVYPDLWRDATLRSLHHSFGFALRTRGSRGPGASVGCAFSREGARLQFSLGGIE